MPDINTAAWRQFTKDLQQGVKVGIPDPTFGNGLGHFGGVMPPAQTLSDADKAAVEAMKTAYSACGATYKTALTTAGGTYRNEQKAAMDKYKTAAGAARTAHSACVKAVVDAHPELKNFPQFRYMFKGISP